VPGTTLPGFTGEATQPPAQPAQAESPFGAACPPPPTPGGGGFGGGGANVNGPFVLSGVYNVALVVDGKTVDTKPLRVNDDPDVALTSVERRRMYDMAMEMHGLQPSVTDAAAAHATLTRQITELADTLSKRTDVPPDVKSSFDAFKGELAALAPKLALPPAGRGGGGGGRGANESLLAKLGQAKNGFTAGMPPGDQTTRAYTEVKAQTPKAIADLNAVIAKATTLSAALGRYNLTLTVPQPVKAPDATPARRPSSAR
jgi:hypothetical protein